MIIDDKLDEEEELELAVPLLFTDDECVEDMSSSSSSDSIPSSVIMSVICEGMLKCNGALLPEAGMTHKIILRIAAPSTDGVIALPEERFMKEYCIGLEQT